MTEEPPESEKVPYFFQKAVLPYFGKKVFFAILIFFDSSIGCTTKFHADEIVFKSYNVRSKVITFFVKNLLKLNMLSVIAID